MNSFKTVLMVGVLVVVAYYVYVSINRGPVQEPPEVAEGWTGDAPQINLPSSDSSGAPNIAMGPNGFASPGVPPIQGRFDELSPSRPFSERAPAPPFSPAPLPPEISSDLSAPSAVVSSDAPSYPSYSPAAPPVGVAANPPWGATPPLPDPGMAPLPNSGMPPLPADRMAGMEGARKPTSTEIRPEFAEFLAEARRDLQQGRFRETLGVLSARYGAPDQTEAEAAALTTLLDQVAGTVIYSRDHHLEPAYVVKAGDTLPQIAENYGVPADLLAKINAISDPSNLQPGQELKVLRGPFRAVVRLEKHEMDLWLQDLYAGRFPIGVGTDNPDLTGPCLVLEKNQEPAYYSPTGRVFDRNDPLNPLGKRRIGLGGSVAIHGTNDQGNIGQTGGPGAVRLGNQDADDVFDILSLGSRVVIQR